MSEISQTASDIQNRIKQLCDFNGEALDNEMAALKQTLLENPAACQLLMPEDIGMLVSNLNRTVAVAAINAEENKKNKTTSKKKQAFTPEELQKALDEEF